MHLDGSDVHTALRVAFKGSNLHFRQICLNGHFLCWAAEERHVKVIPGSADQRHTYLDKALRGEVKEGFRRCSPQSFSCLALMVPCFA